MRCLRTKLSLLLLCLVSCAVGAESVVILKGGQAWYVASDTSTAVKVDRVITITNGGPSDPDPPPPNGSELKQLASTWKTKVAEYSKRDVHRQALSAAYLVLAEQVQGDGSPYDDLPQLNEATVKLRDLILGGDKSRWNEWGRDVGSYLSDNVDTLDEAAVAYLEIAAGLETTEAIGPIVMVIIQLVLSLIGQGEIDAKVLELIKLLLSLIGGT